LEELWKNLQEQLDQLRIYTEHYRCKSNQVRQELIQWLTYLNFQLLFSQQVQLWEEFNLDNPQLNPILNNKSNKDNHRQMQLLINLETWLILLVMTNKIHFQISSKVKMSRMFFHHKTKMFQSLN